MKKEAKGKPMAFLNKCELWAISRDQKKHKIVGDPLDIKNACWCYFTYENWVVPPEEETLEDDHLAENQKLAIARAKELDGKVFLLGYGRAPDDGILYLRRLWPTVSKLKRLKYQDRKPAYVELYFDEKYKHNVAGWYELHSVASCGNR